MPRASTRKSGPDAFSRVSGMPPTYLDDAARRYAPHELSALRVFLALRTASRRVDNVVGGWLGRIDLTVTKFDVLHLVAAEEPAGATIGRLRDFLKMTQPNVTFVVQSLERDGLVRRSKDPNDRRSSIVRVTEAGLARIDELSPSHVSAIGEALAALPERERRALIETLATIAEGFEGAAPPPLAAPPPPAADRALTSEPPVP